MTRAELEKLASKYATEPNSVDTFTIGEILIMKAAYIRGFLAGREAAVKVLNEYKFETNDSIFVQMLREEIGNLGTK